MPDIRCKISGNLWNSNYLSCPECDPESILSYKAVHVMKAGDLINLLMSYDENDEVQIDL